jgi:hypothetical protein
MWLWLWRAVPRAKGSFKCHTRFLVREDAPHKQTGNCLRVINIWSWGPRCGLTPRQTDRLTVRRNITLTLVLTWWAVSQLLRGLLQLSPCELLLLQAGSWGMGIVREARERGTSAAESRYQKIGEECNRLRDPSVSYSDLWILTVFTSCKSSSSINLITNPNPIYSH